MRGVLLAGWLAIGALGSWMLLAQAEPAQKKEDAKPDRKKVRELMGRKTTHSQKVLEALMKNDLAEAGKQAEELIEVRKQASWFLVKTEVYKLWSDQFTAAAEKVVKAAKEKNPELAKLGYLELTMTCFNCHAYLRDLGDISHQDD